MIGPQLLRQDFRQDLPLADLLKTYPLRGWQLALGELLAPAAILTSHPMAAADRDPRAVLAIGCASAGRPELAGIGFRRRASSCRCST